MKSLGWDLISSGWCPVRRGNLDTDTHRRKTMCRHRKKMAIYKPRREASEETNPADILNLNWQPPEMWGNTFLLFGPPSVWYFVMAALENGYSKIQIYRVARERAEEEKKVWAVVPYSGDPRSATCDWTPIVSQVLSQMPRIQRWANQHIPCPSSIDSLSVNSPRGLVKDAGQHPLNLSPWVRLTSPASFISDGNKYIRSFSAAHWRRGNSISFCSWCRGAVRDRKKRKPETRGAEHPPKWASPTSQFSLKAGQTPRFLLYPHALMNFY